MKNDADLIQRLRDYELPDGILRLCPDRQPFHNYSPGTLADAAALVQANPEKRGILTRAFRSLTGQPTPSYNDSVTMEAHLDARDLPPALAGRMIALGFEPDGFHEFMPRNFTDHMTLKYKADRRDIPRRKELWQHIKMSAQSCLAELKKWPDVEAYLELECYTPSNRRAWKERSLTAEGQRHFPLHKGDLTVTEISRDVDDWAAKKADIHIKTGTARDGIANGAGSSLAESGFYRVLTWSGNEVYTAQFSTLLDAKKTFALLDKFFSAHGGAVEMTMEVAPDFWRTENPTPEGMRQAAVPPIVTAVRFG